MPKTSRTVTVAMLCAAGVTAEFVGGKATRDALFLTSLDAGALPLMFIVTSLCSILLVGLHARWAARLAPAVLVPAAFVGSGLLFLFEWLLRVRAPSATAVIVYLHVSGAGPLLASGFWLIASDRFDPRSARRRFGQIAGAGTLGGLTGAVLAERIAALAGVPAMLIVLAGLQFATARLVRVLAADGEPNSRLGRDAAPPAGLAPLPSALRGVAAAPHLRHLMALVLFGTTGAAMLEYLFKAGAVAAVGRGDGLLRFFALYYAATGLVAFVLQIAGSRAMLARLGLGLNASTPSIALLAGSAVSLVAPGFGSLAVARAGESVLRASWFRAGYELFYTPLPPAEKRAAKSVIDVGVDRVGDAVGGALVRLAAVCLPAVAQTPAILCAAMAASAGAILAAGQLNRWYVRSLENSLVHQAGAVELAVTRETGMASVLSSLRRRQAPGTFALSLESQAPADPILRDIAALRSGDRDQIVRVLSRRRAMAGPLVWHAIALLGSDAAAAYALFALRKVAEERVGEMIDALVDPNQSDAVRLGLVRAFTVCVSQRAADGLMLALDDRSFAVRVQAGRSLVAILEKNPGVAIDAARLETIVLREIGGGERWLAHVFTLLSLVLPREPLQIAFRGLQSRDRRLRGTALEYLDGVLPPAVRRRLRPALVEAGRSAGLATA
ncbi:MAG: hypothetical protein IT176_00595 [Acidobacteria bacterium]|nr:hypothetical protein [Acidobacteriota bacterium]